jgi:hypothetical protein
MSDESCGPETAEGKKREDFDKIDCGELFTDPAAVAF